MRMLHPVLRPGVQEKFLIAFGAGQFAGARVADGKSGCDRSFAHALDRFLVQRGVAHDAARADILAVEFKLRLDQDQIFRGGSGRGHHGGEHLGRGDKRNIQSHQVRGLGNLSGAKISGVFLELNYARVLLHAPGHLLGRHVDRIDAARTMLQQAVGEAAGGGADIEASFARGVDAEILERAFQLESGAAGVFCGGSADFDVRVGGDLGSRFFAAGAVYADFSSQDHGLRFFAGFGEAAFDDQEVEPFFFGFWFGGHGDPKIPLRKAIIVAWQSYMKSRSLWMMRDTFIRRAQ